MADEDTITRLRWMTGTDSDKEQEVFPDSRIEVYLDDARVADDDGNEPGDEDYTPTYDLHRAAAAIWRDRAAEYARWAFDTQVDMTRAGRSEIFKNFHRMARYHDMKAQARSSSPLSDWEMGQDEEDEDNIEGDE